MKIKFLSLLAIIIIAGGVTLYDMTAEPESIQPKTVPTSTKINHAPFPDIKITTLDGKEISVGELPEQIILLNFWATWCTSCIIEFPDMLKLVKKYEGKVALVTISIDDKKEAIKPFLKKLEKRMGASAHAPHVYWAWDADKSISLQLFQTIRVPETIFLDKDRQMVKKIVGATDWNGEPVKRHWMPYWHNRGEYRNKGATYLL